MPNLLDTVHELDAIKSSLPSKLVFAKSRQDLSLEASSSKASSLFRLVDVDITKIPFLSAGKDDGDVIIDFNVHKLRATKSGYVPKLLVVSGLDKLRAMKKSGQLSCAAWVGDKILSKMSIMADDAIGSNELRDKLSKLISNTYSDKSSSTADSKYAWIIEIYPFENYVIFSKGGEKYRQRYKLDPIMREASLDGKAVKVFEQYTDVPDSKGVRNLASNSDMDESLLDTPNVSAPALGGFNGPQMSFTDLMTTYGAPGSEANNPMLKLMLNVEDALSMYETEKADGIHKVLNTPYARIPPGLVNAGREATIAASVAGVDLSKFSVMDFLKWQNAKLSIRASAMTKRVNGKELPMTAFAKVGDPLDISTWQAARDAGPHTGKGKSAEREIKKLKARNVSKEDRTKLAKTKNALPDGSFPIANKKDLANAKHDVGRAKNPAKAKAFINKRAKQLGAPKIGE